MGAFDVVGEQVTLVVVQVALITNARSLCQATTGRVVSGSAGIDQIAGLRIGAQAHAQGDGGIE
ncbi:hypothetical protein D3C78_786980 [compost metagenome]